MYGGSDLTASAPGPPLQQLLLQLLLCSSLSCCLFVAAAVVVRAEAPIKGVQRSLFEGLRSAYYTRHIERGKGERALLPYS